MLKLENVSCKLILTDENGSFRLRIEYIKKVLVKKEGSNKADNKRKYMFSHEQYNKDNKRNTWNWKC